MSTDKPQFFDLKVPFFIPLWRRIAVVLVCLFWALFEFSTGAHLWAIVFGGMGMFAAWQLLLSGWPDNDNAQQE